MDALRQQQHEAEQVGRRLQRRGIQVPDFQDVRSVGVCLAAIQRQVEEKKREIEARRAGLAAAAAKEEGTALGRTKQGVPELTASLKAYEREVEKLRARLRKEELEAEAAEALADEACGGTGGGVDPVEVLARVRARADAALSARDRIMPRRPPREEGEAEDGEEEGHEAAAAPVLPVSQVPVEEARRFARRKYAAGMGGLRTGPRPAAASWSAGRFYGRHRARGGDDDDDDDADDGGGGMGGGGGRGQEDFENQRLEALID